MPWFTTPLPAGVVTEGGNNAFIGDNTHAGQEDFNGGVTFTKGFNITLDAGTPAAQEILFGTTVSDDAGSYAYWRNGSANAGEYFPQLYCKAAGTLQGWGIRSEITTDTGTTPCTVFDSRVFGDTAVGTRPLFAFRNNGTDMLSMSALGVTTQIVKNVASTAETFATFGVDDSASRLHLGNYSNVNAACFPQVMGVGEASSYALVLTGQGTTDSGGSQIIFLNARIGAATNPSTRGLLALARNGSGVMSVGPFGKWTIAPVTVSTTAVSAFKITTPADTNQTASTEIPDFYLDNSATKQWATGAVTTQRFALFKTPTAAFVGASTITNAATLAIEGAPTAGTNATITNSYALWVQSGVSQFDGQVNFGLQAKLKSYTVATLPAGTTGGIVYVSDAAGNPCVAFYNGTNWKRCDNAATTVV